MRKLVFVGCTALVLAAGTGAANAQNWTGGYIGGNIGGGSAQTDVNFTGFGSTTSTSASSVVGGVQGGFNWQFGTGLIGVEGDLDVTGIETNASCPGGVFTCTTKINGLGSGRGRLGGILGNTVLVYGTFGLAQGHVEASDNTGIGGGESRWHFGWAAGAGLEAMLGPRWTGRVEYLHYDLGTETQQFNDSAPDHGDIKARVDVIRAAFNLRF